MPLLVNAHQDTTDHPVKLASMIAHPILVKMKEIAPMESTLLFVSVQLGTPDHLVRSTLLTAHPILV